MKASDSKNVGGVASLRGGSVRIISLELGLDSKRGEGTPPTFSIIIHCP
ncbi:MAG: hypothetical protein JWM35_2356 [Verrucomicrobia bacterium]|nr:hypothetical protein [Verrucomicrobiota bacterium]